VKEKFEGAEGRNLLLQALLEQKVIEGNREVAASIMEKVELVELQKGDVLIENGVYDDFIYMVLSGSFDVRIYNRIIARRLSGSTVGEMAAIQPLQPRSATVVATEAAVVARISQADLSRIGDAFPQIWRFFAKDLARRLLQRNSLLAAPRERIRVLILSSAETIEVAKAIQSAFAREAFSVTVWMEGVFRTARYPISRLEKQLDQSDFAIAIVAPDDSAAGAGRSMPAARDNIMFELGLFMGRLGRRRAILLEPRREEIEAPSDLTGFKIVGYHYEKGAGLAEAMAPACDQIRTHIHDLGPNE